MLISWKLSVAAVILLVGFVACQTPPLIGSYIATYVLFSQNTEPIVGRLYDSEEHHTYRLDRLDSTAFVEVIIGDSTEVIFNSTWCDTYCYNNQECTDEKGKCSTGGGSVFDDLKLAKLIGECENGDDKWLVIYNQTSLDEAIFCVSRKGVPSSIVYSFGEDEITSVAYTSFTAGEPDPALFKIPSICPCAKALVVADHVKSEIKSKGNSILRQFAK